MNAKLDPTLLPAFQAIFERGPIRDPHIEAFRRQVARDADLARIASLPRATAKNRLDTCACGNEATCMDYRNGQEIGLCDDCC